jgi:hypothetical protein
LSGIPVTQKERTTMSILSLEELYSNQQAITATAASTNVIDHGAPGTWVHGAAAIVDDKGVSCLPLAIQVTEDFNTLTSLTIDFEVDDAEGFGTAVTLYSEVILLADLVAGKKTAVRYVPFNHDKRYSRVNYTVTGTPPTLGKVTAGLAVLESSFGNR